MARPVEVLALDHPADHVERALEGVPVACDGLAARPRTPARCRARCAARPRRSWLSSTGTSRQPEHGLALGLDRALDERDRLCARARRPGEEADAHAVAPGLRQVEVHHLREEGVGQLKEDARAVACARIGALSAAVLEVLERHQRVLHHVRRWRRVQVRDERDATGIMLVGRVVQAPRGDFGQRFRSLEKDLRRGCAYRASLPRLPVARSQPTP